MARIGISYFDVEKAVLQLQGQGKNPTIDNIRDLLGTGSKSTITQHLKVLREKSQIAAGQSNALPAELQALVAGLWERLNTVADQRILDAESLYNSQLTEFQSIAHEAQQQQTYWQEKCHQLEEAHIQECKLKEKWAKQYQHEEEAHSRLTEKHQLTCKHLEDAKSENTRLHQLASQIQANLEHYQSAIQKLQIEQTLELEKKQAYYTQTLTEAKNETEKYRTELETTAHQLQYHQLQNQELKDKYDHIQAKMDTLSDKFAQQEAELIRYTERNTQLTQYNEKQLSELNTLQLLTQQQEKQLAVTEGQIYQLQSSMTQAEDKIRVLRDEALFLIQEKAQLEGQLTVFSRKIDFTMKKEENPA